MRRLLIRIALILMLFPPLLAAVAGWLAGPAFLHPIRRELTPDLIREADASFAVTGATREDFVVRAPDGALLRGWKVRPKNPNGSWVLLFHGVADNRVGVIGQSEFLLRAGYSVVMMDARAHGASVGPIATYGWLERNDTRAIIDELVRSEVGRYADEQIRPGKWRVLVKDEVKPLEAAHFQVLPPGIPAHIFALGGLRKSPWLGKTLFSPGTWTLLYRDEKLAGFPVAEVSPQKAVAARAFPVLLICDEKDEALPCRHSEMIYAAARGPRQLWVVPRAFHTAAYGFAPEEFRRRVLSFFAAYSSAAPDPAPSQNWVRPPLKYFFPTRPFIPQIKRTASAALASAHAIPSHIAYFVSSRLPFFSLAAPFWFLFSFFPFNFFPLFSAFSAYSAPSALNSFFFQLFNFKHPTSVPFSTFSAQCTGCCRASHSWLSRRTVSRKRTASAAIVSSRRSPPCGSWPSFFL